MTGGAGGSRGPSPSLGWGKTRVAYTVPSRSPACRPTSSAVCTAATSPKTGVWHKAPPMKAQPPSSTWAALSMASVPATSGVKPCVSSRPIARGCTGSAPRPVAWGMASMARASGLGTTRAPINSPVRFASTSPTRMAASTSATWPAITTVSQPEPMPCRPQRRTSAALSMASVEAISDAMPRVSNMPIAPLDTATSHRHGVCSQNLWSRLRDQCRT